MTPGSMPVSSGNGDIVLSGGQNKSKKWLAILGIVGVVAIVVVLIVVFNPFNHNNSYNNNNNQDEVLTGLIEDAGDGSLAAQDIYFYYDKGENGEIEAADFFNNEMVKQIDDYLRRLDSLKNYIQSFNGNTEKTKEKAVEIRNSFPAYQSLMTERLSKIKEIITIYLNSDYKALESITNADGFAFSQKSELKNLMSYYEDIKSVFLSCYEDGNGKICDNNVDLFDEYDERLSANDYLVGDIFIGY